ncbi:MAG: hypothetical protein ACYCW6_29785 [Candidatus Xenobia bacterium]
MRPRGNALVTVLMAIALVALLAFCLSAMSVLNLQLTGKVGCSQTSHDAAEEILAQTVSRLEDDPTFGLANQTVVSGGIVLSFDPAAAQKLGVPLSVNNLAQDTSSSATLGPVPAHAARLYVMSPSGSGEVTLECVVEGNVYHHAIASTGPIQTTGSVIVGALPDGQDPHQQTMQQLLPGSVASNSSSANAIQLGAFSQVRGDVTAVGGIQLGQQCLIAGAVQSDHAPCPIPRLSLMGFSLPEAATVTAPASGDLSLDGVSDATGSLVLPGNLTLSSAILVVDGDLTVHGAVHGTGAIFVVGKTTIDQDVNLQTDDTVALVSKGDLSLGGQGQGSSFFSGIVYTEGSMSVHDVTVVGAVIGNGPLTAAMTLRNASVLESDGKSILTMDVRTQSTSQALLNQWLYNVPGGYGETAHLDDQHATLSLGNGIYQADMTKPHNTVGPALGSQYVDANDIGWDPIVILLQPTDLQPLMGANGLLRTDWTAASIQQIPLRYSLSEQNLQPYAQDGLPPYAFRAAATATTLQQAQQNIISMVDGKYPPGSPQNVQLRQTLLQNLQLNLQSMAVALNAAGQTTNKNMSQSGTTTSTTTQNVQHYTLNPNTFLVPADQLHLLLWSWL